MTNTLGFFRWEWTVEGQKRAICGLLSALPHNYYVICEKYDCKKCIIPTFLELQKLSWEQ